MILLGNDNSFKASFALHPINEKRLTLLTSSIYYTMHFERLFLFYMEGQPADTLPVLTFPSDHITELSTSH